MANYFNNTKWDCSKWSKQQKITWLNIMSNNGCKVHGNTHGNLDLISCLYIGNGIVTHGFGELTESCGRVEMKYSDAFPKLARDNFDEEFDSMFSQNAKLMEESDPNGINQHEAGAKLDNGKVIAASVLGMFANALYAVTEVGTFGANKYTEGGWQHVQDGEKRYANAGMRHFLKRNVGEEIDQDSELPHLAHEAWNKLAELELYLRIKK